MDKEEISSDEHSDLKTGTKPVEPSRNNGAHGKARAKSDSKPQKRKPNSKKTLDPGIAQIAIAAIGLIGTITVAWLSYKATRPEPTPVPVFTSTAIPSPTLLSTDIPATFTELPSATFVPDPSATSTDPATVVPSETITLIPQPKLIVLLQANKTSGKAPLSVKLDARDAYLTDYDGQRHVCRDGTCHYTWKIYSNGQQIGKSVTDSGGTLDYKFGKKGIYTVTVWICRGQDKLDCGGSGIQIVVS
jgi:hypothetical protein